MAGAALTDKVPQDVPLMTADALLAGGLRLVVADSTVRLVSDGATAQRAPDTVGGGLTRAADHASTPGLRRSKPLSSVTHAVHGRLYPHDGVYLQAYVVLCRNG